MPWKVLRCCLLSWLMYIQSSKSIQGHYTSYAWPKSPKIPTLSKGRKVPFKMRCLLTHTFQKIGFKRLSLGYIPRQNCIPSRAKLEFEKVKKGVRHPAPFNTNSLKLCNFLMMLDGNSRYNLSMMTYLGKFWSGDEGELSVKNRGIWPFLRKLVIKSFWFFPWW